MDSLLELVNEIRKRPGMYIGNRSAAGLHLFLQGWLLGKGTADDIEVLDEFQCWIASKYNISSSHSWADIIEFYSEGSVGAFEEFYVLFDEFMTCREKNSRP